jgi:hypothetical protein
MALLKSKKEATKKNQNQSEKTIINFNGEEFEFDNSSTRHLKVCYSRSTGSNSLLPVLNLSGNWLQEAGFEIGDYVIVFVCEDMIMICKEEDLNL